ncbi:hypothetical protein DVH05_008614 [Phytophthora capsici]|nr:hypothetical protein DVH05_008614 [Phytophthora capsici]
MSKCEQAATSTPAGRQRHERSHPRVYPYPARSGSVSRELLPSGSSTTALSDALPLSVAGSELYELRVQPIVKETVAQRDLSGNSLDLAVVSGNSFHEIKKKLWDTYGSQVRSRAVKTDGVWSAEQPDAANWTGLMQFKLKKHFVDSTKTDQEWHQWLVETRGQTVTLLIYKYGSVISQAKDLLELVGVCALQRARAATQVSLEDIVVELREKWGKTFQGADVVWTMWGNHIKERQNWLTLAEAIDQLPPPHVTKFLRLAQSPLEMSNVKQSVNLALVVVQESLKNYQQLRCDWETLGRHLEEQERQLVERRNTLEAIRYDLGLPASRSVRDAA